jgi:hypothetical protein
MLSPEFYQCVEEKTHYLPALKKNKRGCPCLLAYLIKNAEMLMDSLK